MQFFSSTIYRFPIVVTLSLAWMTAAHEMVVRERELTAPTPASPFWNKVGADIDGEASNDNFGKSVAISADGTRVAVGATGTGGYAGHTQVFEQNNGAWTQLGGDIDGEAAGDYSGCSVSLSADGTRVAVGASANDGAGTDAGHTRVFQWSSPDWIQVGENIDGEAVGHYSGISVSLSADGTRVAVGAEGTYSAGRWAGYTRVLELIDSSWTQVGENIDGEADNDYSGFSVSLSADGTRVAIGANGNDGAGTSAGHTRVFALIGSSWTQLGGDIDGEAAGDYSGISVSLSADGTRVAIGADGNDSAGSLAGHTRVLELIDSSWTQLGGDIDGKATYDTSGSSVSLSADGIRVAVGANGAGRTQIYQWSNTEWTQLGGDINSDNNNFVSSVSMSADGTWVAVGAIGADEGNAGRTQVYMLTAPSNGPSAECLVKNDNYNYDGCDALNRKKCIGEALCKWNKSKVCAHVCYNRKNKKMCHTQRFKGQNICKYTPTTDAPTNAPTDAPTDAPIYDYYDDDDVYYVNDDDDYYDDDDDDDDDAK